MSIDQRILSHVEAVTRLREIFDSVNAIPPSDEKICASCNSVGNWVRQMQERVRELSEALLVAEPPCTHAATQTDADANRDLIDIEQKHEEEKRKLTSLVK